MNDFELTMPEPPRPGRARPRHAAAAGSAQLVIPAAPPVRRQSDFALEAMAAGLDAIHQAMERLDRRVEEVASSVQRLPAPRREIKASTKAMHLAVLEYMGDRCPCCKQVVIEVEHDHFFTNQLPDFEHTWPLCPGCHGDLTHGRQCRSDVQVAFHEYQRVARRIGVGPDPQGGLF